MPRELEAGVAGGAEARVVGQRDHLGAVHRGERDAAVARAGVDHDQLRALGQVGGDRAQQQLELGLGVVQHDHDAEAHAAASRTALRARPRGRPRALAQGFAAAVGEPRAQRLVGRERAHRVGEARDVAGRHVQRAGAGGLAQGGDVGHDRGRAVREALERRVAVALAPRGQHDGHRARVQPSLLDRVHAPEDVHTRPAQRVGEPPVARQHERLPVAGGDETVERLARLERADVEEVAPEAGVRCGGRARIARARRARR